MSLYRKKVEEVLLFRTTYLNFLLKKLFIIMLSEYFENNLHLLTSLFHFFWFWGTFLS